MTVNLNKGDQQFASIQNWFLPMLMIGRVSVGEVEEALGMVAEGQVSHKKR